MHAEVFDLPPTRFRPGRPGTALVLYQCTTVPSILYAQSGPYQKNWHVPKKFLVHGPFQLSVRSSVPSRRLCAMMAHENERIARENEKNEARGDEGARPSTVRGCLVVCTRLLAVSKHPQEVTIDRTEAGSRAYSRLVQCAPPCTALHFFTATGVDARIAWVSFPVATESSAQCCRFVLAFDVADVKIALVTSSPPVRLSGPTPP